MNNAKLSPCGLYRYELTRQMSAGTSSILWVMLNPSTADAELDDPTIRKCIGFSMRWGFARLTVVNVFALRATDPAELDKAVDPIGPETLATLEAHRGVHDRVVLAWGAKASKLWRHEAHVRHVEKLYPGAVCLGFNRDGSPKHPLYIYYGIAPVAFRESP